MANTEHITAATVHVAIEASGTLMSAKREPATAAETRLALSEQRVCRACEMMRAAIHPRAEVPPPDSLN